MRILIAEDDPDLNRQLAETLTEAGYAVDAASDGEEARFLGETEPYDAVVLDLGLPELDGVSVLKVWRSEGRDVPVLVLTARDQWSQKVAAFDAGADDYVTKPFNTKIMLARVRAGQRMIELREQVEADRRERLLGLGRAIGELVVGLDHAPQRACGGRGQIGHRASVPSDHCRRRAPRPSPPRAPSRR